MPSPPTRGRGSLTNRAGAPFASLGPASPPVLHCRQSQGRKDPMNCMRMVAAAGLAAGFMLGTGVAIAADTANEPYSKTCRVTRARDNTIQNIEPTKIFDNLYLVGPCYVSVWLLTTPQGDILFDTTQEPFVDHVLDNIKKVGVNPRDIKYIILSHGHLDHVGGAAKIQEATGARLMAMEQDWQMMADLDGKTNNRDGGK